MTHDELLAKINQYDAYTYDPNESLIKALRAVVELHSPWELENNVGVRCSLCANYDYPCPTIQATEKELS